MDIVLLLLGHEPVPAVAHLVRVRGMVRVSVRVGVRVRVRVRVGVRG